MSAARKLRAVPDPRPAPTSGPMVAAGWDLRDMPDNHLECRAQGHDFPRMAELRRWTRVVSPRGELLELRHGLTCRSCLLMLTEVLDARTGERHREHPAYPDGYLRKGQGRLPRWAVRLEEIRRLSEQLGQELTTVVEDEP